MRSKPSVGFLALLFIVTLLAILWIQPAAPVNSQIFPTFPVITLLPTNTPVPVPLGNIVWDDLDADGIQEGEPGLAGATVQLWNASRTVMFSEVTTGIAGFYQVTAPGPGDYRIRAILPGSMDIFSPKHQGNDETRDSDINPSGTYAGFSDIITITINSTGNITYDVGGYVFRTATPTPPPNPVILGNFVWHDINQNGIQDTGENGVPGVTVQLWNSIKTHLFDQTTTNSSGMYQLTAPYLADYRIQFLPPMGSTFSPMNKGMDEQKDSDAYPSGYHMAYTEEFTLTNNLMITNIDAGFTMIGVNPTPPPPGGSLIFLPIIKR